MLHQSSRIDESKAENKASKNHDISSDQSSSSTNPNNETDHQHNISQSSTTKKKKRVKVNHRRRTLSQTTTTSKATTVKTIASLTKGEVQLAEIIEFSLYRQNMKLVNHTIVDHVKEIGPKWKPELKKLLEIRKNSTKKTAREWIYSLLREDKKRLKNAFDTKRKKVKEILENGKPYTEYDLYLTETEESNYTHNIPIEVLQRKPLHKIGDKVKACFNDVGWYDGKVHNFRKKKGEHYYDIVFDDGDSGEIHEVHVQSRDEYDFQARYEGNQLGPDIGICNWCSSNTGGSYEKGGGWWKCNKTDKIYLTLSDLIREQDDAVVKEKTIQTRKEDLQCPSDWNFDVKPPIRIHNYISQKAQKNSPFVDTSFEESSDVSDQVEQFPLSPFSKSKSSESRGSDAGPEILEDEEFLRRLSGTSFDDLNSLDFSSMTGSKTGK